MDLDTVSSDQFVSMCEDSGVICRSVKNIRPRVFRATIERNTELRTVYGKIYANEKRSDIQALTRQASDIGLPHAEVIIDDVVILLLDEADGQPLSYVLPATFLPGIWHLIRDRIEAAYSHLGRYLGTQHAQTESGTVKLLRKRHISQFDEHNSMLAGDIPELEHPELELLIEEVKNIQVPQAVVHSDPSPHNIFYRAGDVTLIDNAFTRKGVVTDHANVLLGIWLMVGRLPYVSRKIGDRLEEAYWRGYRAQGIDETTDRILVSVHLLRKYFSVLGYYKQKPNITHAKITKYMDKPAIIDGVRRELRLLSDANLYKI